MGTARPSSAADSPITSGRRSAEPPRKRVLLLTHRVPYPLDRGDRIRAYHLLEHLSRRHDVSIASTSEEPVTIGQERVLHTLSKQVEICRISSRWGRVRGLSALAGGQAITPACFYRRRLNDTIRQWHEQEPFDVVLTYCTGMIHYARALMQLRPRPRHVLDLVDVDSAKWLDYAKDTRGPLRWVYSTESRRLRRIEAGHHDHFDAITVVSDAEADLYRRHVGLHSGLSVLRHAVDVNHFRPLPDARSHTILFVGVLSYRPNADGIRWFVKHVMPLVRRRVEDARLWIVGHGATPRIRDLGRQEGVDVIGAVSDVREYLGRASAVIAPLRIARGVQTKVLEAMSAGRAVVCSPGAAEGILAESGRHLLVADDPVQWAHQLEQVLGDDGLRTGLGRAARRLVERDYSWHDCLKPLDEIVFQGSAERARTLRPAA